MDTQKVYHWQGDPYGVLLYFTQQSHEITVRRLRNR
jgi:hypothetical protein